jgi:Leucine-rich repeat (LRR) protein
MPSIDASGLPQLDYDESKYLFNSNEFVLSALEKFDDKTERLDFSRYDLEEFPKYCLLRFTNLKYLNLAYNHLVELPELPDSLTYLNIDFNYIKRIEKLPPNLSEFYCSLNGMEFMCELPNSIRYLNCYTNRLTVMPNLPNQLIEMDCHSNFLTNFPELSPNLKVLYVSDNNLETFPKQLVEHKNLTTLWIDNNYLGEVDLDNYVNLISFNGKCNPWKFDKDIDTKYYNKYSN